MGDVFIAGIKMPVRRKPIRRRWHTEIHVSRFMDQVKEWRALYDVRFACVEKAQSSPQMGVGSAFSYGLGYGQVIGMLSALDLHVVDVPPQAWKHHSGLSADKDQSLAKAFRLFCTDFGRDDGIAEAALLARYKQLEILNDKTDPYK